MFSDTTAAKHRSPKKVAQPKRRTHKQALGSGNIIFEKGRLINFRNIKNKKYIFVPFPKSLLQATLMAFCYTLGHKKDTRKKLAVTSVMLVSDFNLSFGSAKQKVQIVGAICTTSHISRTT